MKNMIKYSALLTLISLSIACTTREKTPTYTATLDGKNEVPPVMTQASGFAEFWLSDDTTDLRYKLTVHNLQDVIMAHLHLGAPGTNGEHIAWLYPPEPPEKEKPGLTNGILAEGTLTSANLIDTMQGQSIKDLVMKINQADIYVNVHTKPHPDGELRGTVHKTKEGQ